MRVGSFIRANAGFARSTSRIARGIVWAHCGVDAPWNC
jgi:hypothetical protein